VIGDVHGCLGTLEALVKKLGADPDRDHFCFVGDIVNRGPESLNSLRWIMNLGDRAYVTLGNHDLHLLATLHDIRRPGRRDTLDEILAAPDRDQIIDWLRTRPVLHDNIAGFVMVHAGIHPHWSLDKARAMARELEHALAADDYLHFLADMYGNEPTHPRDATSDHERLRCSVNVFTRMRFCHPDGSLEFDHSAPPCEAPSHLLPWYAVPGRRKWDKPVVFGHWSAHPAMAPPGIIPTDRGCVWKGHLAGFNTDGASMQSVRYQD
jgi:bis(5'-nucleosyl)-tetraphosphatase (symmetrical)